MNLVRCLQRAALLTSVLPGCVGAASAQSQTDLGLPAANPGRPTITNPATLTPVGYLQFEQGYLGSLDSPQTSSQYGLNQTVKITVHPRLMLQLQSQPFAASSVAGTAGAQVEALVVILICQHVLRVRRAKLMPP